MHAAEIVIEKARRMVEHEVHAVILLDSITRSAQVYNTTMPKSDSQCGSEATALQRPKWFLPRSEYRGGEARIIRKLGNRQNG